MVREEHEDPHGSDREAVDEPHEQHPAHEPRGAERVGQRQDAGPEDVLAERGHLRSGYTNRTLNQPNSQPRE